MDQVDQNMADLVNIYFASCQKENISFIYDVREYSWRPGGIKGAGFEFVSES